MIDSLDTEVPGKKIEFSSFNLGDWIGKISEERERVAQGFYSGSDVDIFIPSAMNRKNVKPIHLVTFACLVQQLKKEECLKGTIHASDDMISYLDKDLHFSQYFSSKAAHIKSESNYNLNLWMVSAEHAMMYSSHVADYLRRNYFKNKDLSILRVVLDELYANIADHSEANGIAYSFIKYDVLSETVQIAFCDFGIGIKRSLQKTLTDISKDFIMNATRKGISARSNTHNRGFGLDTVVSSICGTGNTIKIVSGNELFVSYGNGENQRTWITNFDFKGTLIYFDLPISTFEDIDYFYNVEL